MMTDDEITAIAKATETAEPGTDGYILPVSFARAIENAVIIKLAGMQNAPKDEIRLIWKPKCDALRQQLEAAQAEVARLIRDRDSVWALKEHKEVLLSQMTSERDAALARLAEIEADASTQPKMVTPYITQEHFDKAFPVNVPPSQAQPPAPGEAAREYMTGYSDGREWAGAKSQAQPERAPLTESEISKLVMPYGLSSIQGFDHIKAYTRRVEAYIKQGGQDV